MRKTILALTVIFLAPTAVMASVVGQEVVGTSASTMQKFQVALPNVGTSNPAERNIILAKGDKSGTGPGRGGHKGAKKGEHKGGQPKGDKGEPKPKI